MVTIMEDNGVVKYYSKGYVFSVSPCDWELDKHAWGSMVPEARPDSVLLIGICGNTVGNLIKARYPGVKITQVDIEPLEGDTETIKADAYDYILNTTEHFDYLVMDIYVPGKQETRLTSPQFLQKLGQVADIVCLNSTTRNKEVAESYLNHFDVERLIKIEENIIYLLKAKP